MDISNDLPILKGILQDQTGSRYSSVRFGRVPKREKAKILAAMQSVNQKYQERAFLSELEDDARLVRIIVQAHLDSCEFTWAKVGGMLQSARRNPTYSRNNGGYACPLSPRMVDPNGRLRDSQLFGPHIKAVVDFAKQLPGFLRLPEEDRVTLLKSSVFEVLLVWLACMFDTKTNTAACLNGELVRRDAFPGGSQPKFLLDSMFNFAEQLNALRLSDAEIGLFCACVVLTTERPGLRNLELIGRIHHKMDAALRTVLAQNHPQTPDLYEQLSRKVHDLKTLNTLHSDMIRSLKEPEDQRSQQRAGDIARCPHASLNPAGSGSSPSGWPGSETVRETNHSPHSLSSGYVGSEEGSVQSPAGGVADLSPSPDAMTASSAAASHPHLVAALQPRPFLPKRKAESPAHGVSESSPCPSASGPASPCSSPRSLFDERGGGTEPFIKAESEDYMPLLKQALSKPSLAVADPSSRALMEAAFVPHKKFRWMRRENDAEPAESSDEPDEEKTSSSSSSSSRTPTLSRILGAPPQRGWSAEQIRQREAVAQLLSMHAGYGLPSQSSTPSQSPSPAPTTQTPSGGCPYSSSQPVSPPAPRMSPAPRVPHLAVAPPPMPPHHVRHVSPAPVTIAPPPPPPRMSPAPRLSPAPQAHSPAPVALEKRRVTPPPTLAEDRASSSCAAGEAEPSGTDLSQVQPLNLSKKMAQPVALGAV